jgi:hypothetical protein
MFYIVAQGRSITIHAAVAFRPPPTRWKYSSRPGKSKLLKDSPFSDAKALLVTFSEVNVHASGADWITVPFAAGASSRTCDLKKLETAQDVLGVTILLDSMAISR